MNELKIQEIAKKAVRLLGRADVLKKDADTSQLAIFEDYLAAVIKEAIEKSGGKYKKLKL